jgi:hypothetical protein
MNWNQIKDNWKQLNGNIQQWAKFTNNNLEDGVYNNGNAMQANKFGYPNTLNDNSVNVPHSMQDGEGASNNDSVNPDDGAGKLGTAESNPQSDSGNPNPNPMRDNLNEPTQARDTEAPRQEKFRSNLIS